MIGTSRLECWSLHRSKVTCVVLPAWMSIIIAGIWMMCSLGMCAVEAAEVSAVNVNTLPQSIEEAFVVGKVKSVSPDSVNQELLGATGIMSRHQLVQVEIVEGPLKGKMAVVRNEITDNPAYNILVRKGQDVILSVVTEHGGTPEINIADYRRAPVIVGLLGVFLLVFLLLGGRQGVKSLAGLLLCVLMIAFVLLPLSLRGVNPLLTSVLICLAVTVTSTTLVAGLSVKALCAILGTVGGVIVAGVAAEIVIVLSPLTGLSSEEAQILRGSVLSQPPEFFSGLLAAGMLIGGLGVIMDIGMSIASAVWEVSRAHGSMSVSQLYCSGMNVGRDIMGTMTTTLVLAYTGSALPLLLLVSNMPSTKLLNLDLVATELASALTGSLGLVCTIPLTALAAAKFMAPTASTSIKHAQASPVDTSSTVSQDTFPTHKES